MHKELIGIERTGRVPARVTGCIGEGRVKEMMFTGDPIGAATAIFWGLVSRVVPADRVLAEATGLARTMAERPANAVQIRERLWNARAM